MFRPKFVKMNSVSSNAQYFTPLTLNFENLPRGAQLGTFDSEMWGARLYYNCSTIDHWTPQFFYLYPIKDILKSPAMFPWGILSSRDYWQIPKVQPSRYAKNFENTTSNSQPKLPKNGLRILQSLRFQPLGWISLLPISCRYKSVNSSQLSRMWSSVVPSSHHDTFFFHILMKFQSFHSEKVWCVVIILTRFFVQILMETYGDKGGCQIHRGMNETFRTNQNITASGLRLMGKPDSTDEIEQYRNWSTQSKTVGDWKGWREPLFVPLRVLPSPCLILSVTSGFDP